MEESTARRAFPRKPATVTVESRSRFFLDTAILLVSAAVAVTLGIRYGLHRIVTLPEAILAAALFVTILAEYGQKRIGWFPYRLPPTVDYGSRYRTLIENTIEGIFEMDASGRLLTANGSLARLLGRESAPDHGTSLPDIARFLGADPTRLREFMDSVRENWKVAHFEIQLRRTDGVPIWVSLSASAVRRLDGSISGIDGDVQDISNRKALEDRIAQGEKYEAVGRLAGGIAHDFNNLLTVIMGRIEMMHLDLHDHAEAVIEVDSVKKVVLFASDLTRQLLAFSRQQVLQPVVLDPNCVIREIAPILQRLVGDRIELSTVYDPALPGVRIDPTQFRQVLMNLVVNARDAMPGGGRLTVVTSNHAPDDPPDPMVGEFNHGSYVRNDVQDAGMGMSDETISHIFEPYFTTRGAGHGTGLSSAYGVIRQSGRVILVTSVPGDGSSFAVVLPAVEEVPQSEPFSSRTMEALNDKTESVVRTAFPVEDNAEVREILDEILTDAGYETMCAENGEQALQAYYDRAASIDAIVTDVVMPGLDGFRFVEMVRKKARSLPVLFVSGYVDGYSAALEKFENAAFLQKPFLRQQLYAILATLWDSRTNEGESADEN